MVVSRSQKTSASKHRTSGSARPRAPKIEATRRRLLEAGLALFAEYGPRTVTSHALASEAGYASGTFYLHFKDKAELFRELAEEAATELERRLIQVAETKTEVADIIHAQAEALVGFAEEQRDLLRIIFHPGGEAGDVAARILERLASGVSARRRERADVDLSLKQGPEQSYGQHLDQDCFNPDVLAQAVVGMWAHVLAWWAEDPTRASREDLIQTLTHFQLHGKRLEGAGLCGSDSDSMFSTSDVHSGVSTSKTSKPPVGEPINE